MLSITKLCTARRWAVTSTAPDADINTWLRRQQKAESPALSERLIRALEAHQAAEAHDLAECRALQRQLPDPAHALLLDLIAEGTRRHERLLEVIAEHLRDG